MLPMLKLDVLLDRYWSGENTPGYMVHGKDPLEFSIVYIC